MDLNNSKSCPLNAAPRAVDSQIADLQNMRIQIPNRWPENRRLPNGRLRECAYPDPLSVARESQTPSNTPSRACQAETLTPFSKLTFPHSDTNSSFQTHVSRLRISFCVSALSAAGIAPPFHVSESYHSICLSHCCCCVLQRNIS